ncbi:unnamed protein product [Vicia faba]|uniref:Uncharacterized protein n=1 Tax=Vicia faba TaxID=3906 RepID=A0AAV0YSJ2_VICFA|nr:unnamed protein product [Vicia faba]
MLRGPSLQLNMMMTRPSLWTNLNTQMGMPKQWSDDVRDLKKVKVPPMDIQLDDFKGISSSKEEGKQTTLSRGVGARGDRSSSGATQQATICATPNYSSETSASFPSYPSFPSVAVSRILFIVTYCVGKSLLLSCLRAKYL